MNCQVVGSLELRASFDCARYHARHGCKWAKRLAPKLAKRLRKLDRLTRKAELRAALEEI